MPKVLGSNAILGGQEYKAGTKDSDISADVKGLAGQFLIDEKNFKAASKLS